MYFIVLALLILFASFAVPPQNELAEQVERIIEMACPKDEDALKTNEYKKVYALGSRFCTLRVKVGYFLASVVV